MTANVTIDVAVVRDVLRIPNAALRFKPDTGTTPAGTTSTAGGQRAAGGGGGGERGMAGFGRGRGMGGAAGMMPNGQAAPQRQSIHLLYAHKKLAPPPILTRITGGHDPHVADVDVAQG